jgi:hypothetical protein
MLSLLVSLVCRCAVAAMNAAGLVPICYFSSQYEKWRPDNASFPANALGSNLDNWPGERRVDIRRPEIRNIMAAVGCDLNAVKIWYHVH